MDQMPDGRVGQPPNFMTGVLQAKIQIGAFAITCSVPAMSQPGVKPASL